MEAKLPYYMAYPMPFSYDDGRTEQRDFEYMKSMYPDVPKRLLPYVEEECDRMEYENSMIYDAFPDKLQLKLMCRRICDRIEKYERTPVLSQEVGGGNDRHMRDLIEVMVYQELYKRRCDHRRNSRKFY